MFEKRRYHPIAILIYLIAGFKKWLPLLIVSYISEGLTENWWGNLFFFGVVLSLSLQALLRYFFEYYQLFEEKIVIYKGIFQKKEIDIPYERIQTIKERQWFFFKPFQITELLIETAATGAKEAEVDMSAVSETVFQQI